MQTGAVWTAWTIWNSLEAETRPDSAGWGQQVSPVRLCGIIGWALGCAQILFFKGGSMPAEVGDVAPDFKLPSPDGDVSLGDYKGKKTVVLSFHVFDFTAG